MSHIAIVSPDASEEIRGNLRALDLEPVAIPRTGLVERPISGHPDIQVFVHENRIFCHPDISRSFIAKIEARAEVVLCATRLSCAYPDDIPYNVACTGSHAFHHAGSIDPAIREYLSSKNIALVGVRQGYAKCTTLVVDAGAIVTADRSIHEAASLHGIESLEISPGSIDLPGYRYGFIGGATGACGNMLLCTGTLEHHPDYKKIAAFISGRGKRIVPLSRRPAVDLGTILII